MNTLNVNAFKKELHALANPDKALVLRGFFKTGSGEYGEGDKFFGITVPQQRKLLAKYYQNLNLADLNVLLNSAWHEERSSALLILIKKYQNAETRVTQHKIYEFYLENATANNINNWDLVDQSAPHIIGHYVFNLSGKTSNANHKQNKKILHDLVQEKNPWLRRIAIVATLYFIRNCRYQETLHLAKKLLTDKEDLIHKASGWMLREVGKRDGKTLEEFLQQHAHQMPRTMLRYAIEHFPQKKRQIYLALPCYK